MVAVSILKLQSPTPEFRITRINLKDIPEVTIYSDFQNTINPSYRHANPLRGGGTEILKGAQPMTRYWNQNKNYVNITLTSFTQIES